MNIIKKILSDSDFAAFPPVLVDIGASGSLHHKWNKIAKFSICIAFDPDVREMEFVEKQTKDFRKLIVFNKIVATESLKATNFYLTKSAYCSSTLLPNTQKLQQWIFSDLFKVEKTIQLDTITLNEALILCNIKAIDWLKIDTQGTDLRIFKSLPLDVQNSTLAVEFEPGILDAYINEDKLSDVVAYMNNSDFWMADLEIKGTVQMPVAASQNIKYYDNKNFVKNLKNSPGWAEILYFKKMANESRRQYLLSYVFCIIEKQYSYAYILAEHGYEKWKDPIFIEMKEFVVWKLKIIYYTKLPIDFMVRKTNKVLRFINRLKF